MIHPSLLTLLLLASLSHLSTARAAIDTTAALVAAVRDGAEGASIEIAPGTFELEAPLEPKSGMTLKGVGMDKTILTHTASWKSSTKTLPDPEMTTKGMDTQAYLIRLKDKAANITVSDLTLRGPQLHGAIYGWDNTNAHLHHLRIQDTLWTGIRTFLLKGAKIHDCEFIDAGGRWERGEPGLKGGITGGAIFAIRTGGDFKTITIRDNIIECQGQARPLLRCQESYGAVIRNNRLTNLSDTNLYQNPQTDQRAGLEAPLKFECGVHGEFTVDGWQVRPSAK